MRALGLIEVFIIFGNLTFKKIKSIPKRTWAEGLCSVNFQLILLGGLIANTSTKRDRRF